MAGAASLELNGVRFDASRPRGHVESWFVKANDPSGDRAIWLKATIYAASTEPDRAVAEGWAIAFDRRGGAPKHRAVKCSLPFARASFATRGLAVRFDEGEGARLELIEAATKGAIASSGARVAWDLRWENTAAPILPYFSHAMYTGAFPKQKLLTPAPDARVSGEVTVDGEAWTLDGWRGMQGHNWGRGHSDLYAWAHVSQWDQDEPVVLEGMSGKVKIGPVMTPLTTIVCVRHRGVAYDFNAPLDLLRATGDVALRRWEFSAKSEHATIEGTLEASTEDFVGLYYANPDGAMTYCLNSKLARARVHFEPRGRAPILLTSRAAALEIGTRDDAHGVRMYV
ncbi:MAG TPA: hypothetical protein VGM56_10220 [Byssovorax sp.]|jgi:hypothetical protein